MAVPDLPPHVHQPRLLANGYSEVPPGKLAAVVTCLEMLAKPAMRAERADVPWQLRKIAHPNPDWYRELFRRIGSEWLWYSRLALEGPELVAILSDPAVEVYALTLEDHDEGLLELDFREAGSCEVAFFGLSDTLQGRGAGRWLMNRAVECAWSRPIGRLWVHTCTLDHPDALEFYVRSGFHAYARRVEVADDPRLSGLAPPSAAAHVPIIASAK